MESKMEIKKSIFPVLITLIGIMIIFRAPRDPDFGWHYKYGEYMVQHMAFLRQNIYSFTFMDYQWANSYWISEIIIYLTYNALGPVGMSILFSSIFCSLLYYLLNRIKISRKAINLVFVLSMVYLANWSFTVRPLFFSTLFLTLELYILIYKKNLTRLFPVLFLFWANAHADFVIGLSIFGFYLLFEYILCFKDKSKISREILINTFILILSAGLTIINPYGILLWKTLINEIISPQFYFIKEWLPLAMLATSDLLSFTTMMLFSFMFYIPLINVKENKKVWLLFCGTLFLILGLRSVYFLRIFTIITLFETAEYVNSKLDYKKILNYLNLEEDPNFAQIPKLMGNIFFIVFFLTVSGLFLTSIADANDQKTWATKYNYPYGAIAYLKANPIKGNMFNSFGWGGYLIWQLPEYKTFIDGRMTSWKVSNGNFTLDVKKMETYPYEFSNITKAYFNKYNFSFVLEKKDSPIVEYLLNTQPKKWQIVYKDETSIILKKLD